jgi:hypothetical protein
MIQRFSLTSSLILLAFQVLATAQSKSTYAPPQIKISIASDSAILTRGKPALVTVTIENISGAELELSSSGSFHLASMSKKARARNHQVFGDRYWSPVNLTDSAPVEIKIIDEEKLKEELAAGRAPKVSIQLAKCETKTLTVDLTKFLWNASMSSTWPTEPLFKFVPKGSNALSLSVRNREVNVESNPVEVAVK